MGVHELPSIQPPNACHDFDVMRQLADNAIGTAAQRTDSCCSRCRYLPGSPILTCFTKCASSSAGPHLSCVFPWLSNLHCMGLCVTPLLALRY